MCVGRMLHELRRGVCSPANIARIRACERPLQSMGGIEPIKLTSTVENCEKVNNDRLQSLSGEARTFKAIDTEGKTSLTSLLNDRCIAPPTLILKIGAQVM